MSGPELLVTVILVLHGVLSLVSQPLGATSTFYNIFNTGDEKRVQNQVLMMSKEGYHILWFCSNLILIIIIKAFLYAKVTQQLTLEMLTSWYLLFSFSEFYLRQ